MILFKVTNFEEDILHILQNKGFSNICIKEKEEKWPPYKDFFLGISFGPFAEQSHAYEVTYEHFANKGKLYCLLYVLFGVFSIRIRFYREKKGYLHRLFW